MDLYNYSKFSQEDIDKFYEMKHIDAYGKIEDSEGWLTCRNCGVLRFMERCKSS